MASILNRGPHQWQVTIRRKGYPGVTMLLDITERLNQLQQHHSALCLYALVDGVQYETHRQARLMQDARRHSLFTGTPDAALAHAGPWLVDVARSGLPLLRIWPHWSTRRLLLPGCSPYRTSVAWRNCCNYTWKHGYRTAAQRCCAFGIRACW
ncbi:DUF4123 domain-containing protein [Janthinobacterium sp. GW458P]|uniref:DUF4123 domain-containing protein n=1 Tax=Janthinobacterium sp. GW458P TaxID=1981504 RepID=UPI00345E2179